MATMMEPATPNEYPESPMEGEEVAYTCQGCGEILEEGKAFELSERRWHLDCFRCNQCHTLLDSDANLLLLGDGSLICNNCTYSCSACGNKIEDLAILTGDQAFCATCFRCRNCKRKIENLRYARTSQGIFCMSCHESLMARRRKKSKAAAAQAKAKEKEVQIEKSLPALPPNEISAFSPDRSTFESERSTVSTELSPPPRIQHSSTNDSSRTSSRRGTSPERGADKDGLTLPTTTYRNNRHSHISQASDATANGDDGFYIPLALDPSPAPQFTPRSSSHAVRADLVKNKDSTSKDYFSAARGNGRTQGTATPTSQVSTPHIAFQANGRTMSSEHIAGETDSPRRPGLSSRSASAHQSPAVGSDEPKARHLAEAMKSGYASERGQAATEQFRLQEVPRRKKSSDSRAGSSQENDETGSDRSRHIAASQAPSQPPRRDISSNFPRTDSSDSVSQNLHKRDGSYLSLDKAGTPRSSAESKFRHDSDSTPSSENGPTLPMREAPSKNESSKSIPRKEVGASNHKPSTSLARLEALTSPKPAADAPPMVNGKQISPPVGDDSSKTLQRPPPPQQKLSDTYMAPRAPPAPPVSSQRPSRENSDTTTSGDPPSPKLPRWSAGGDFNMEDDMARILGADEGSQSILRRVSNAVRHGRTGSEASAGVRHGHVRSISETTARMAASHNWPKTPLIEDEFGHSRKISSPISTSSARVDDPAFLRRQLRNSELRVAELEKQFSTTKDLKNMNKQLVEKRKTVSELGSQAEIMVRQIETLAGFVERAKSSKGELNIQELEDSAIKEFVQKLERLKQSMSRELETLFVEREQLLEEKDQATKARDRALIEFEQLSSKNAQLAEMNNDLTTQIQERFKAQSGAHTDSPKPNGLGIYHSKDKSSVHLDDASMNSGTTIYGASTAAVGTYPQSMDADGEPATVLSAPHVVNIRKGQAKKFNWGKKGATVAKGVTKGFKGAFYGERTEKNQQQWQEQPLNDNIGMPYNMTKSAVRSPDEMPPSLPPRHASHDPQGRFGIFKKSHNTAAKNQSVGDMSMISAPSPATLFGSDLTERADYEGRQIPSVVIKCIQEVEVRGMDVEGIYRKTGGSNLTKQIQDGFEKSEDFDISADDMDITAITSVLKQYFRKLPVPLLTYDVYDRVLAALNVEDEKERCTHLRETINQLPEVHRNTLEFLCFHLSRIKDRKDENLMTPKNIAVVFAPTIMRDTSLEREMTDMQARNDVVQFMIEHSREIFDQGQGDGSDE